MKGLNNKANTLFMQLIDQMAGLHQLSIPINERQPLTLTLIATDIYSTSQNTTGNLYNLSISDTSDRSTRDPGMQFLVFDRRIEQNDPEAVQIFPVSYRHDAIQQVKVIVTIIENHVREVNHKWQREYARFGNQWLKKLAELGYIREQLQRVSKVEDLACLCGNNVQLDGFDFCDASGKPLQSQCICRGCKRTIDLESFEVVSKGAPVLVSEITLDINKAIIDMSDAEKAKLLHVLCPDIIRAFLAYVNEAAQQIIESEEHNRQSALNESLSLAAWKELAKKTSQIIATSMNRLVHDCDLFAKELFVGYIKIFLMHCIQEYMMECQNQRLTRGIEFIFDL